MKSEIKDIGSEEVEELKNTLQREARGVKVNLLYAEDESVIGIEGRQELPPLGLLYVAGMLRECGINVKVIPFNEHTPVETIPEADVYGYGITSTVTYPRFLTINREIRGRVRNSLFIAGNTQSNVEPERIIQDMDLDGILLGEGEFTIMQLIRNLVREGLSSKIFKDVNGGIYKNDEGAIIRGSSGSARIKDLDAIPVPARELLPDEFILLSDRIKNPEDMDKKLITFITSRGCPFSCMFCANINNGTVRYRGGKNMRDEIGSLKKMYPEMGGLLIMDETATLTTRHVEEFTEAIGDQNLVYVVSTRGDVINERKLQLMQKSGCREIKFGFETGSPELLKAMNKKLNLGKMKQALRLTKKHGIRTKVFIMHGYPGENERTTRETIDFLKEMREEIDRAVLYRFTPLPGSPIFYRAKEFDLHTEDKDFQSYSIYKNNYHWWGSEEDFRVVNQEYERLSDYIAKNFKR